MKCVEIEMFSETVNCPVIRVPGRRFPGILIQGDSLSILLNDVKTVAELATPLHNDELDAAVEELRSKLAGYIREYESVMQAHRLELPYVKPLKPEYQLVLQLSFSAVGDFDAIISLVESTVERLGSLGKVDGYDTASGGVNIFIFTDQPQQAFEAVKPVFAHAHLEPELRAAFREVGKDQFTILHPNGK